MALYKGTLFFKSGTYGWSETFYDTQANLNAAFLHFAQLAASRRTLLNRSSYLQSLRVSDDVIFRDAKLQAYSPASGRGTAGPDDNVGEQPFDGILFRLEGGNLHRRSYIMRGIPTGVVNQEGVYAPGAFWVPLLTAFVGQFVQGFGNEDGFEIKTSNHTDPVPVTALIPTVGNAKAIAIPVAAVPGAAVKDIVQINGVTTMAPVNGRWRIKAIAGGQLIMYPRQRNVIGTYGGEGFATKVTFTAEDITAMIPIRGKDRDTGRPSDSPRGRRRTAKL